MTQSRPTNDEAIERIRALDDAPVTVHAVTYVYDTEYAHVYLVAKTQQHNGHEQLHLRYAALSKPGAYQMDQWKQGGMTIRMVEGMAQALPRMVARACNEGFAGGRARDAGMARDGQPPLYTEVENETN